VPRQEGNQAAGCDKELEEKIRLLHRITISDVLSLAKLIHMKNSFFVVM
jgi:hypothetical protein